MKTTLWIGWSLLLVVVMLLAGCANAEQTDNNTTSSSETGAGTQNGSALDTDNAGDSAAIIDQPVPDMPEYPADLTP